MTSAKWCYDFRALCNKDTLPVEIAEPAVIAAAREVRVQQELAALLK
jgi:hypothetical protein